MSDLESLIERLAALSGPDREADLAIHVAVEPDGDIARTIKFRRGFDHEEGMAWELWTGAVVFEQHDASGRCFFNGGYPLPRYSESIDAALTLIPDGWCWGLFDEPNAWLWPTPTRDLLTGVQATGATPAIALCIAALRARAQAQAEGASQP